jgi:signal transduction histidine kinase/BarA-like signal transduction histidine kinase
MSSKIKILVVDDYKENIEALVHLIHREDIETHSATNAEEALELITKHDFGLALLDVQMPDTTGFELAAIIRGVKKFKALPIIFVTAHQEDSSFIFQGYQTGAVDLLFKPLDPNMVRAKVQMFVELAQQRNVLQSQVQELEQLRVEANAANLAKSQFLANMSHEIRTPLAAVMGFAELIANGVASEEERKECAAAVKRNSHLLMRLIDDILDLSKIEANKLELERTIFDLGDLLRDVESTMSFRARENGVTLKFTLPIEQNSYYAADSVRIKQALLNIIGNAIKFSPQGGNVTVTAGIKAEDSSKEDHVERLVIAVTDEGIGLTRDQSERLFKPFTQADTSTKRRFGGSGLGLTISREIARATGGDVRLISSESGKGSCFEVEFLIERSTIPKNSKTLILNNEFEFQTDNKNSLKGRQILAVDDSPDNLALISLFLKDSGAEITFAENGFKAIAEAAKKNFDLILMDVQMPGMDGHEATSQIRSLNFKNPIIALTAHALRSEHDKCKESGCDSVLTKPISRTKLMKELKTYLE